MVISLCSTYESPFLQATTFSQFACHLKAIRSIYPLQNATVLVGPRRQLVTHYHIIKQCGFFKNCLLNEYTGTRLNHIVDYKVIVKSSSWCKERLGLNDEVAYACTENIFIDASGHNEKVGCISRFSITVIRNISAAGLLYKNSAKSLSPPSLNWKRPRHNCFLSYLVLISPSQWFPTRGPQNHKGSVTKKDLEPLP